MIEKEYVWNYNDKQWTISLSVPQSIYDYYQESERIYTKDYSIYVTHPTDDEYLNTLCEKFNFISITERLTEKEKTNLIISFVQSLPYTYDNVTTGFDEYPRYPIETLVDGGGDCEDTSILTASLLESMNYDVILLGFPQHVAVGVNVVEEFGYYFLYNEERYYFLETTGEGWEIGDVPESYRNVSAHIYEIEPVPILEHNWNTWYENDVLMLNVTVKNVGTKIAEDFKVSAYFEDDNTVETGLVWSKEISGLYTLQYGRKVSIVLELDVPIGNHIRLCVNVLNSDGYSISQSFSEWSDA